LRGITTYSPLRHWKVGKGKKVALALGWGIWPEFAHAFGAHVVLLPRRGQDATLCVLGADEVVISKNDAEMQKHAGSFDFILDAVPRSTT